MNKKLAACLVLLALLVAGLLYLVGGERDGLARGRSERGTPAPAPVMERAVEEDVSAPASTPSTVAREASGPVADAAAPPPWRGELAGLIGRVVESDGQPVAGMRVALLEFDTTFLFDGSAIEAEQPTLELEETVTDDEGRFLLGGARAPAFHGLGLDLGGPRATVRVIDRALVHHERTDVGDVVLAPYGVITGRVVDASGAPVAGARVRFAGFPEEVLKASPQEFRGDSLISINLSVMGGEGLRVLELPGWVRGAIERFPVPTTQSAADGTFRLEGVELAKLIGGVDKRGYVGVPLGPIDLAGGEHDVGAVVLVRGRTIRGVVEDTSGEPVAGIEVHAGAEIFPGVAAILQPCGATDGEGRFELTGVAETGQVVAAARRAPHEPWSSTVTGQAENVLLEVEELVTLTVNVRDEQDAPLAGARIQLAPAARPGASWGFDEALMFLPRPPSPPETFREVEPGRQVCAGLGAGMYDVTVRAGGLAPAFAQADCRADSCELTVTVRAGRAVELQVLDAVTKAPVQGAQAIVLRAGPSGFSKVHATRTDGDGHARLGPLPELAAAREEPGPFPQATMLLVQHPSYGDHSATLDEAVSPLVVALEAGGTLAGRVHWGGATPTRLYMLSLEFRGADGMLELFHLPRLTLTDLAGEFRMVALAPGKYRAELSERFLDRDPLGMIRDEFDPPILHREELEIRNGETTQLVIDLGPSGRGPTARIVGRVRMDGRGLEGAEVDVRGNEHVQVQTDSSGRFETPAFSIQGTVWVGIDGEVRLGAGPVQRTELYRGSLELAPDEVHQLDLDLYPLTLRVTVVDAATGEPVPEANVSASLKDENSRDSSSTTTATGEAELLVLGPGEYMVNVGADGFANASSPVTVPAEGLREPSTVRLQHSIPCAGRVLVGAAAEPQRGFAYIQVQGTDNPCSAGTMLSAPEYTFELEGLGAGKYRTWIYLGGQRSEGTLELGPDGDRNLEIAFVPGQDGREEE